MRFRVIVKNPPLPLSYKRIKNTLLTAWATMTVNNFKLFKFWSKMS